VGVHNVTDGSDPGQMDLFDTGASSRKRKVEEAVLALARKRGKKLVTRARLIPDKKDDGQ